MTDFYLPENPLGRFLAIHDALVAKKTSSTPAEVLNQVAMTLTTTAGQPAILATQVFRTAEQLKDDAGWFGQLNSSIRFILAAQLLRDDQPVTGFAERTKLDHEKFRDAGLRHSPTHELVAVHILRQGRGRNGISAGTIARFREIYEMMKSYHWWLTGPDDYPTCAMLTLRDESVAVMGRRIEALYKGLKERLPGGDPLQLASHVLYLNPLPTADILKRFFALYDGFRSSQIRMWQTDYDELSMLSFLDQDPATVIKLVKVHRQAMSKLRPRVDASGSFSLACSTAFIELSGYDRNQRRLTDMSQMLAAQAAITAQQAAVICAVSVLATSVIVTTS